MKYLIFFILQTLLLADTSFITPLEYSARLYKDPRGIGCQLCHGEKGEGKIVASYIDKKIKKSFGGPAINKINYELFYKELNRRKNGMPRYFLTDKEIASLYLFLHQSDEAKTQKKSNKSDKPKKKEKKVVK